jgi:hypothetical protein
MRRSEGEHRSIRLAGWAAYRAWRATGVDLILVGVLVGWLAGLPDRRGPTGILGGALGLALVLTGVTTLSSGRRRSRMLNEANAAGRPPTLPATRLPLLVSSIVTGAGLLLAVLDLLMAIRP